MLSAQSGTSAVRSVVFEGAAASLAVSALEAPAVPCPPLDALPAVTAIACLTSISRGT